jgi:dihydrofolate synthase/folylpolyglutamate synthase
VDFARSDSLEVQQQLDRLAALVPPGDVLGLERIRALLERLGKPERRLPPVFHVAGTNGKGSTCAFLRAAIEAAGLTAHVYTSPHLVRFNERIRLAGALIDDAALAALLGEVLDVTDGTGATFFEVTTAAALLAFSRQPADACVIEVGLGGRLDATNVIERPAVCGIAHLGLDHQGFLGTRIEAIAAEKAGIAKPGVPLVTQLYSAQVAARVGEIAHEAGASWLPRGGRWDAIGRSEQLHYHDDRGKLDLPLPRLPGAHQSMNAALAIAMLRHQDAIDVRESAIRAAVGWAEWPARLQLLGAGALSALLPNGSELWLDGGHNPAAARAIAEFLRSHVPAGRPLHLVFGLLQTKDVAGVLKPLRDRVLTLHGVPIAGHVHHSPADLVAAARRESITALPATTIADALGWIARHAERDAPPIVLIMGSLYLAGEVLKANGQVPS